MAGSHELMLTALGRALASAGHELNNVVGVVHSYAAFIQEGSEDAAVVADAQVIREAVDKGARLARQLLAFGHPRESEAEPLELGGFVLDVAGFVKRALGDAASVEVAPGVEPVVALLRRAELGRVLLALCLGLRSSFAAESVLVLETRLVAAGPAGPASAELWLAERQRQVPAVAAQRSFALPAELTWVEPAVRAQAGTLEIEAGPTLRVALRFPALSASELESRPPPAAPADAVAEARGTETVLVLEASSELRQAMCRMLEAAGYRVLEAEDEATALGLGLEGGVAIDVLLSSSAAEPVAHAELFERLQSAHPLLCRLQQLKPFSGPELQRAVRGVLDERIRHSHAAGPRGERVLALVVDDDPHVRLALSRLLDDCGADVVTAPSGLHALQKLQALPIDLLIADQAMPGMEGTRLLETAYKSWPRVARVVYTGYLSPGLIVDAVNRASVHKVLAKDMQPELLRAHLGEVIAEIRNGR